MFVPMFKRRIPSAQEVARALLNEREERKFRKNKPREEIITKNVYQDGPFCRHLVFDTESGGLNCGPVSDKDLPSELKYTEVVHKKSYLLVVEFRQYWERKNGRETGKLLREEFVRVVSRTRTDKCEGLHDRHSRKSNQR